MWLCYVLGTCSREWTSRLVVSPLETTSNRVLNDYDGLWTVPSWTDHVCFPLSEYHENGSRGVMQVAQYQDEQHDGLSPGFLEGSHLWDLVLGEFRGTCERIQMDTVSRCITVATTSSGECCTVTTNNYPVSEFAQCQTFPRNS